MSEKRKPYKKGLKADYQGASPEQVARVVLSYTPNIVTTPGSRYVFRAWFFTLFSG